MKEIRSYKRTRIVRPVFCEAARVAQGGKCTEAETQEASQRSMEVMSSREALEGWHLSEGKVCY